VPFFIVAGLPNSRPLGDTKSPCPTCKGPRALERRWHTIWLMVLPLFSLRERVVAACASCKTEQAWTGPVPPGGTVPLLYRVGFMLPFVAGGAWLVTLLIPAQLTQRANAELQSTPGGKILYAAMKETGPTGCGGTPYAFSNLACDIRKAAAQRLGRPEGRLGVQVFALAEGKAGAIVGIKLLEASPEDALSAARAARPLAEKAFAAGLPLVVFASDFNSMTAFVAGKIGGDVSEGSGSRVDMSAAAALVPPDSRL
jgi:hypothetical protein